MRCSELLDPHASALELRVHQVDSELVTVTLRSPFSVCESAKEYVGLNGLSFMPPVKQRLAEKLTASRNRN